MPRRKHPRRADVKDIRSILRLTHESGLSVREVSDRLGLSKSTVSTYLLRAREAGLDSWLMPEGSSDDAALERKLFRQMGRPPRDTTEPDWQLVSREMKRKGVTLLLLWQEYREAHPHGFGSTWFCDKFGAYERRARPTYRNRHIQGRMSGATFARERPYRPGDVPITRLNATPNALSDS